MLVCVQGYKQMKILPKIIKNKSIFVQRNIIKESDDLPRFIDQIFDKIYKHDLNPREKTKAKNYVYDGKIALGTSLYTNLLQPQKPMGACTVLSPKVTKDISKQVLNGVGVGFDLTETNNPIDVVHSLNKLLMSMDGKTQRPPAGIALLDIYHKDIDRFIALKNVPDYPNWRFNLSVSVPDRFMQSLSKDENVLLTNGREIKSSEIYANLVNSIHSSGEPGIVFRDIVESSNPLPNHKYKGMASCAEIALEDNEMCLFSHINLPAFMKKDNTIDFDSLADATKSLSRLLDNVININLEERIAHDNVSAAKRRFGIGVCGYADILAQMNIPYGSKEAQNVLASCLETMNFASKQASMELAKERGRFPLFSESRYNDFSFLMKHSEGTPVSKENWQDLYHDIQENGIRNATTTALPPTGSSSRIVESSFSIEPYFSLKSNNIFKDKLNELNLEEGQRKQVQELVDSSGDCQNSSILPDRFKKVFRLGNQISYTEHLETVGTAQRFVDDGISKTVNIPKSSPVSTVDEIIKKAYDSKLKGITVFREN